MKPGIKQHIEIVIPSEDIRNVHLSCPAWSQEQINGSYGIIRDYRRAVEYKSRNLGFQIDVDENRKVLNKEFRAYDVKSRRSYVDHIDSCVENKDASVLAIGDGNLLSNMGIVGFIDNRMLKVCGEESRITKDWKYSFFYYTGVARIDEFDFNNRPERARWAASGQPILWNGEVLDLMHILPETYDLRHIYQLRKNDPESLLFLKDLTESWVEIFQSCGIKEAKYKLDERIKDIPGYFELKIEDEYLQSAIGVDDWGNVYIAQRHGSIEELAIVLKNLGADRAILLDQGASVGTFYRSPKYCPNGRFILQSPDFRDTRLCILVFELEKDLWIGA